MMMGPNGQQVLMQPVPMHAQMMGPQGQTMMMGPQGGQAMMMQQPHMLQPVPLQHGSQPVQQFPPQMPMVVHCDQIQLQPRAPVLPKPPSPGADLAATAAAVDTTAVDEPAAAGAPAAADKPDDSGPLPQGALNGTEKMIVIAAVKAILAV